jgi:hypothetical protein
MISSTATVLAYYPDEFLINYKRLDDVQRDAVRDAVYAAVRVINAFGYKTDEIIPKYQYISDQLD